MDGKAPVFEKMGQQYCQKSVIAAVARVEQTTAAARLRQSFVMGCKMLRAYPNAQVDGEVQLKSKSPWRGFWDGRSEG